jgi:Major tropism determinant N-terminal domain/Bacterial shufflon protein, N-terminal constant region
MALNITKILFRRGTDAQRLTVAFEVGEPAYSYDTNRLFVGDGSTPGGRSLGMKNLGNVASLTGTYLQSGLSQTAYEAISANGAQIGDIIFDRKTTYLWALTSLSSDTTTPALSNFTTYAVYPAINTSDFVYSGKNLTLNTSAILPKHINTTCLDSTYFTGGNTTPTPTPITLNANSVFDSRLAKMAPYSVKVNAAGAIDNPKNLEIKTLTTVLGRGTGDIAPIVLQATAGSNDVTVTASGNTINFYSQPALKLTGGTMTGPITMGSNVITTTNIPSPLDVSNQNQLINKAYADALPSVKQAELIYGYVNASFVSLTGDTLTGNIDISTSKGATANQPLLIRDSGHSFYINSNTGASSWNPLVQANDKSIIFHNGTADTGSLVIGQWSSSTKGIRIASTGYVGIGTATPSYKLDVSGSIISDSWVRVRGDSGIYFEDRGGGWNMTDSTWIRAYNGKSVWVAGDVLACANRIGAGTSSPSYTLDVNGTARTKYLMVSPQDTQYEGGEIQLQGNGGSYGGNIQIDNYNGNARIHTLASGKQLQILGGTISVNGTGDTNYMASGLQVDGYLNVQSNAEFGGGNVGVGVVNQGLYGDNTNIAIRNYSGGGAIYFQSYGGAASHMVIRSSDGNTGIGAWPSGYKLDVGGDIITGYNSWLRTRGESGWYSETYGGGWRMYDYEFIRNFNNKRLAVYSNVGGSSFITDQYDTGLYVQNYNWQWIGQSDRGFPGLEIISGGNGRGGGAAYMNFHRPGQFAVRFGLDGDNMLKVGGWSMGNASYKIFHEGNLVFTGGVKTVISYSNITGSWDDTKNYNDVFPPAGYSMSDLRAFIPSIHAIWFGGVVNSDDAIRCSYGYYSDRIRVWVQNTEQRNSGIKNAVDGTANAGGPYFNWFAIWSRNR